MKGPDPLATLLVREGILPQARVEEANERTVLLGGRLDTALLELGLMDEAALLPVLSRAYGVPVASRADVVKADRALTHVFPRRLSEKHEVVPLEVAGRRLVVAVSGKPDLSLLDEIGFMLSVYVKAVVVPEARLAWARARLYGAEVPARLAALLRQLGETDVALKPNETWTAKSSAEKKPAATSTELPPDQPAPSVDASGWTVAQHVGLARGPASAPAVAHASGGSVAAEIEAKVARAAPQTADERRRTERVQWTVDDAIAELALADERDAMLDVVLRFAYRRMSTVAIFIVHGTSAADGTKKTELFGWDLIDPLLTKNDIGAFSIGTTGDHALAQVVQMQSPFLGPLKDGDPLARLFGRRPRACVLVPILVGDKIAGVLYGDAGTKAIPPSSLAELHMVVPRLGKGLKNLILRKKKALRQESADAQPDVVVGTLVDESVSKPDEREEAIAVSPVQRPRRPTIEIDVVDLESAKAEARAAVALDAPQLLTSDAPHTEASHGNGQAAADASPDAPHQAPLEAPAGLQMELATTPMPWADGAGDDEEVRLDPAAVAELTAPPKRITARLRLEMPELAPAPDIEPSTGPAWADGGEDDEDVSLDASALGALGGAEPSRTHSARVEIGTLDLGGVDDGEPGGAAAADTAPEPAVDVAAVAALSSLPDGEAVMPPPEPAGERTSARLAAVTADSPGASARESLLMATWHDWLKHEDDELDALVGEMQLKKEGARDGKHALAALTAHGARAMPSLARYFPGALTAHPFGAMDRRPDVEEMSDCLACLVRLGADLAAPILVGELGHEDRLHRWTAVWALSRLRVPGAVPRLGERALDAEPAIAALAREVLDGYRDAEGFERVLQRLRDLLKRGDAFERARAIDAVQELRDRGALGALTDLLGIKPREVAEAARRALVEITKQDFGNAERRWRAWIADNDSQPRVRWLIEGLSHKDEEIRKSAQLELNRLTGQYFGYRYDASRAEREQGLQAWQDWWSSEERASPRRWS